MPHDLELLAGKGKPVKTKETKEKGELLPPSLPKIKTQPEKILPTPPAIQLPSIQIDIEKELAGETPARKEKRIKEKIAEPIAPKPPSKTSQISLLYKEGKSLYRRKFYNEALGKFNELLLLKPSHLRAKWFSGRAKKKISKQQKPILAQKSEPKKEITERKIVEEKEIIKQPEKKIEEMKEEEKPETKEPKIAEEEKIAALETQEKKMQEEMEKIRREAAAKAEEKFIKQLQEEEERLKSEQMTRQKLEQELALAKEEREKMEERIKQEREALVRAPQPKITEEKTAAPAAPAILPVQPLTAPSPPPPMATAAPETKLKPKISLIENLKLLLSSRIIKIFGVIIVAGILFVGLVYFTGLYKIISSKPAEQPTAPVHTEEVLPPSLFPVDQTKTITLQVGQKKNLFQSLNKLVENNYPAGAFARLLVKFTSENQEQKYASLVDLADALQIVIPSDVLSNLENSYTLFLYSQKEIPSSPFLMGLGENKLGIAVAFRDREKVAQQFLDWQKTMPSDLDALFLGKKITFTAEYQFQEKTYGDFIIHSVDLPNEYSSLNYAFVGNNILITTSAESIESLIDKLAK